jgi:hypothetical protein
LFRKELTKFVNMRRQQIDLTALGGKTPRGAGIGLENARTYAQLQREGVAR